MDHRLDHVGAPENVVSDLSVAKNGLELIMLAGKGIERTLPQLRASLQAKIVISDEAVLEVVTVVELIDRARAAREHSYAPYSHFNVGAAILAGNIKGERLIVGGCNVENAAYGSTVCAERTAAFSAVKEGFRRFYAYAVVGGFDDSTPRRLRAIAQRGYVTPCGPCQQVTNEFEEPNCAVILARDTGEVLITTLGYLPAGFGPRALGVRASDYDRHSLKATR